jgi:glucosamine--fructose-6-phosphate aminotransferase (isomerizing)
MSKKTDNDPNRQVLEEISDQPRALNDLTAYYLASDGYKLFPKLPDSSSALFTGMGASFHAAQIGAQLCLASSVQAQAVLTSELLHWPPDLFAHYDQVFYISQSGASREVAPLLKILDPKKLTAITNDPASPLTRAAKVNLPLLAGEETFIASKTYLNSLALLWLLSRHLAHKMDGSEADHLKRVRQRVQVMVEAKEALSKRWIGLVSGAEKLILLGGGLQAVSARQASLMLAEWGKVPSLAFPVDEFRHGFVELLEEGVTVVVFQSSTQNSQSEEEYLHWMEGTGACVILVRDGYPQLLGDPLQTPAQVAPELSTLLDTVSAQLLALQLAEFRGSAGFRYLSKVVR